MTLKVVILAGGEGSRMGGGKPLRRLAGRSLLDRAIQCAGQWSDEVAVAVRAPDQIGRLGLPILTDPPGLEGPLAGLASALSLEAEMVLTIPCDAPFLPADLAQRLIAALPGYSAALPVSAGRLHPVCGLWRTDSLPRLWDYAASGRRSLIGFAETIGFAAVEWPQAVFFNVNRPEDLAQAEARLASRQ